MNIGQTAKRSGVSAKTIRYYESVGLLPAPPRTAAGYRVYSETDIAILCFVRRARSHGFTVENVADLLALWRDRRRTSAEVKMVAVEHIRQIERKRHELEQLERTLRELVERCEGDDRPDCPILEAIAAPHLRCDPLSESSNASADGHVSSPPHHQAL
jgi:Cu(I)-responsive transcriptional regulator